MIECVGGNLVNPRYVIRISEKPDGKIRVWTTDNKVWVTEVAIHVVEVMVAEVNL